MQYSPGEYIALSRQLEDPNDLTTRFVRAYVRKKKGTGDVLLATLDMEDQSGQRFTYAYQCPQDSDFYTLNVVIKVFDDSSYLVESNRYERREQDYEIAERWGKQFGGFTGPGSDIDYGRLRKIVKEEVKNTPKTEIKEVDLKPLMRSLEDVNRSVKNIDIPEVKFPEIKIPEQKKPDLEPILRSLNKVQSEVKNIKIPENDLSPILTGLRNIIGDFLNNINKTHSFNQKDLTDKFEELKKDIKSVTFVTLRQEETKPEPVKKQRIFR